MRGNRGRYEDVMDCPRKYFYKFNPKPNAPFGLVGVESSAALRTGSAAHKFMEVWYENLETPQETRLSMSLDAMFASFDKTQVLNPLDDGEGDTRTEDALRDECELLMTQYVKRYGPSEDFTVLQPEVRGDIKLGKHIFVFRADAVVSYQGRFWLMEHKTTWQLGPSFLSQFLLNHQLTMYTWGTSTVLGKLISGILLNALRKPSKSAHIPTPEYYRETFLVTEDHIKNALESFHYTFSDIESRDPMDISQWPQNTRRCHDYGKCPYWNTCAMGAPAEVGFLYKPREPDYVDDPSIE